MNDESLHSEIVSLQYILNADQKLSIVVQTRMDPNNLQEFVAMLQPNKFLNAAFTEPELAQIRDWYSINVEKYTAMKTKYEQNKVKMETMVAKGMDNDKLTKAQEKLDQMQESLTRSGTFLQTIQKEIVKGKKKKIRRNILSDNRPYYFHELKRLGDLRYLVAWGVAS